MKVHEIVALVALAGCAGGGGAPSSPAPPAGPARWPPGHYLASAQLALNAGAMRAGSSARRQVQAEVWIDPDGSMTLVSGEGSCAEHATDRANVRNFSCGDAAFNLVLQGEAIRGTAVAPLSFWVSGWSRCTRWVTDDTGRQSCAHYEEHEAEERTARASGRLSVVTVGG